MWIKDVNGLTVCPECGRHYIPDLERPIGDNRRIQQIFPDATSVQREQVISGICSQRCWNLSLWGTESPGDGEEE